MLDGGGGREGASGYGLTVVQLAEKACGCVRPEPGLTGAAAGRE